MFLYLKIWVQCYGLSLKGNARFSEKFSVFWSSMQVINEQKSAASFFCFLGCMAERLKGEILNREKMVDLLAGPDAYRDLPRLLAVVESGQQAANVLLSLDETYADIMPVQTSPSATSAFV